MSFYNQASRVTKPTADSTLVFSPNFYHATYHIPQSKYTYAESLAFTHHFLTKYFSRLHRILKSICKDRVTISPHQVCHPIIIDVMKGIEKALSEQPYNLAFFMFLGSNEFTNPSITGGHHEVHLLTNDVT